MTSAEIKDELRIRARLAWGNKDDTEENRERLMAAEGADPNSKAAWDRVALAVASFVAEVYQSGTEPA